MNTIIANNISRDWDNHSGTMGLIPRTKEDEMIIEKLVIEDIDFSVTDIGQVYNEAGTYVADVVIKEE